jgi:hypothetical protein
MQIASGNRSARLRQKFAAWYAPKEQPATIASAVCESAWTNGISRVSSHHS